MPEDQNTGKKSLIQKLSEEVAANLENEQYSVEELAKNIGMSRSQLHRKLQEAIGKSVSQFIREYRLQRAMEILKSEEVTSSEVAYRVGFGSASYFSTCFNEFYGYPPGEVKKRLSNNEAKVTSDENGRKSVLNKKVLLVSIFILVFLVGFWGYQQSNSDDAQIAQMEQIDKSIAVIPFVDLSQDGDQKYFSDGVMESVSNHLTKIGDLKVISATSMEQYRGTTKTSHQIGEELGVAYLVEGSVQRAKNQVRITVKLIDASQDKNLWSNIYDEELTANNLFSVQSEIAKQIALSLRSTIDPDVKRRIEIVHTDNLEAYDNYLKGMELMNDFTPTSFIKADKFFKESIRLDSNFVLAYIGVSAAYILRSSVYGDISFNQARDHILPALNKAFQLNDQISEIHQWIGAIRFYTEWDFEKAETAYLKALELNPNSISAMWAYKDYLLNVKRFQEAKDIALKSKSISPYEDSGLSLVLYYLGEYENSIQEALERIKSDPNPNGYSILGMIYLNTGNYQKSIKAQTTAIELAGRRQPRMLGWLAAAHIRNGQKIEATEILKELKNYRNGTLAGSPAFFIAVIYSSLGKRELALEWLEISFQDQDWEMSWLISEPQFYPLHDDPRFQELVKKVGFPE